MDEILPGIFTWSWFSAPHGYNFNGHLILDPSGNICIDPVEMPAPVLDELAHRGVAWIVLTNRNHTRASNSVRARTSAGVAIHPADAEYARGQGAEIDRALAIGEKFGPLEIIGLPGKSPGEVALFWPSRRLLIVGDAIIGNPPGKCCLLREAVMDDPARLRESVRELLALNFHKLIVGDGTSILSGAKERVKELVDSFPR